jgi:predicted 3-demethylubiquinone-9 3-methyltransferase (glyoxalase superfamily)
MVLVVMIIEIIQYFQKKNMKRGQILVEDISLMGLGFSCMEMHNLQQGDQLEIAFRLDNAKNSEINLWVEVKHVRGQFIGVQRCDTQLKQPDIEFYLR